MKRLSIFGFLPGGISLVACAILACFYFRQARQNDDLEAFVVDLQMKIDRMEEALSHRVSALSRSVDTLNEKVSDADLSDYQAIRGSVENLSQAVFGVETCCDLVWTKAAFRLGGSMTDELDSLRLELDEACIDINRLKSDVSDARPLGYYDVESTVESLSKYIFGQYPKTIYCESLDGSLQDQIEKLNRLLKNIEIQTSRY